MATEIDHIQCANRTQATIAHLLTDVRTHSPWVAITAFYKALHIVEAVFANSPIGHCVDHKSRGIQLKAQRRYEQIARHYLPLERASLNARYLAETKTFDDYLSPEVVVDLLLKHHLIQLEKSARKFLNDAPSLRGIESAFIVPSSDS